MSGCGLCQDVGYGWYCNGLIKVMMAVIIRRVALSRGVCQDVGHGCN